MPRPASTHRCGVAGLTGIMALIAADSHPAQRGIMASKWQNDGAAHPITDEPTPSCATASHGARRFIAIWSGIGFVAGSLFWSVVSSNPQLRLALQMNAPPEHTSSIPESAKLPDRLPDSAEMAGCVALILDRSVQQTSSANCPGGDVPLQHLSGSVRQDRLTPGLPQATTVIPSVPLSEDSPIR